MAKHAHTLQEAWNYRMFDIKLKTHFFKDQTQTHKLACEIFQTQLAQAEVSITSVIEEDSKGVAVLIQLGSSDDPQVLQREVVKLVQGHQHIACYFSDRLWTEVWREVLGLHS